MRTNNEHCMFLLVMEVSNHDNELVDFETNNKRRKRYYIDDRSVMTNLAQGKEENHLNEIGSYGGDDMDEEESKEEDEEPD